MGILKKVSDRLSRVRDPETGLDVMRMKVVRNLRIESDGHIRLTFRPPSALQPCAFQLAIDVKEAVRAVPEVKGVHVDVEGFVRAEQLTRVLNDVV
jgi:metal-sulfur cluster biosynthetic enzyme